jgi:hypothetical protein
MNNSETNPNPQSGIIVVNLQDNYNRYLGGFSGQVSPLGAGTATIVAGNAYVITSLGTTTSAQWTAAGVPLRFQTNSGLPSIGQTFIAAASETIPGAPTVNPPSASGIDHIEVVGDPNITLSPIPNSPTLGARLTFQCLLNSTLTAPADGTVISLSMYMNDSSVQVAGE